MSLVTEAPHAHDAILKFGKGEFHEYEVQVHSHGGNNNPAVKAVLAAMFLGHESAHLEVSEVQEAQAQAVSAVSALINKGIQLG